VSLSHRAHRGRIGLAAGGIAVVTGLALLGPAPARAATTAGAEGYSVSAASLAQQSVLPAQAGSIVPRSGSGDGIYLVQLAEEPVVSYRGTIAGLRATRPAAGTRVDSTAPDVRGYLGHLANRRSGVLRAVSVPAARKIYDYNFTFAGFAARLTGAQAAKLAVTPGVLSVTKDSERRLDTVSTPRFLGLTGAAGVWEKQAGGPARAGEGVIVASIDSGLWPENASFAAQPPTAADAKIRKRFKGSCDAGLEAPAFRCNNKVIGGRYFVRGTGPDNLARAEYLSPRGYSSHGSHTAAIAAGNAGVTASV
jgi:hypothetical protein